ncbi:hypothetical protein [Aliiglaciecola sp. M165]|uniref:hypothetical protein n=1 Tax=Aliiglaciecola sp. M165 TaxID=2593649 RepID=UPI00117E805F|nr:hypothetical protein [Aliiglaciecola sp. M165]TRY30776.1 hypothetical protein FM019_12890 [Aliiglaciecola sp. M165]
MEASDESLSLEMVFELLCQLSLDNFDPIRFDDYLKSIAKHGECRKFTQMLLMSIFSSWEESVSTKLSILAILEGDGEKKRWVKFACELIESGYQNSDLKWPLEMYSICRGSIIIRGRRVGIPLFNHVRGLKKIRAKAEIVIDKMCVSHKPEKINFYTPLLKWIFSKVKSEKAFEPEKKTTIVFVASRPFPDQKNTHFNVLLNVARALTYEAPHINVKLALSPEDALVTPWGNFGVYDKARSRFHTEKWKQVNVNPGSIFPEALHGGQVICKKSYMEKMFNWITKQEPTLVVFLSGVYESYVARALICLKYKTVFLPTSIKHIPKKNYDTVVSTKDAYYRKLRKSGVDDNRIFKVPVVVDVFHNTAVYEGESVRGSEKQFIICSVLGGGRLLQAFQKFTESDFQTIQNMFQTNCNLRWVLVGENKIDELLSLSPILMGLANQGKLLCKPFVKNLRGFYRDLDCVFNVPGVTGGGQGIAAAISENLAVVTWEYSDCCSFVPVLGQYNNLGEATELLLKLSIDVEFYDALKRRCIESLSGHTIEKVAKQWQSIVEY